MKLPLLIGLIVVALALAAGGLWWLVGGEPRRWRAYRRALNFLQRRGWAEALEAGRNLGRLGAPSPLWKERLRQVRGESERLAGDIALEEQRFEDALEYYQAAAPLLGLNLAQERGRVVAGMLAEARGLFANASDPQPLHDLLAKILHLQSDCNEALFWQGLVAAREGREADALALLQASASAKEKPLFADMYDSTGNPQPLPAAAPRALDPLLYSGALLLKTGRVAEAVRQLSEANRLYGDCPLVHWQLGTALVANGNDSLALRALAKAVGPKGLPRWLQAPQKAWTEAFPPSDAMGACVSFVRCLAEKHLFRCPVFGDDIASLIRQAKLSLAEAYAHLGKDTEAAGVYRSMLQEGPPTLPVLRGLGLALARQEQYDLAFPQLRAAFEMEQPKNPITAAHLALCGARARPSRPEDRPNNLRWAVQLLARLPVDGDAEWARLCGSVLAEARAQGVTATAADLRRLCDALASVEATTPEAAQAYEELAATDAAAVKPSHAWLYCRAAQIHNAGTNKGLGLFAQTLRDDQARAFFTARQWNVEDIEYAYLRRLAANWQDRSASLIEPRMANSLPSPPASGGEGQGEGGQQPSQQRHNSRLLLSPSPPPLSPEAGERGESLRQASNDSRFPSSSDGARQISSARASLLLTRSRLYEQAGQPEEARASAEALLRLSPRNGAALDRLAQLAYRRGNLDEAVRHLQAWQENEPEHPIPCLRRGILEQQRGRGEACLAALAQANERAQGVQRAAIAFVCARVALNACPATRRRPGEPAWDQALAYLQQCLPSDPSRAQARTCLAAMLATAGRHEELAALAPAMRRPEVRDSGYQYLSAVCELTAGQPAHALAAAHAAQVRAKEEGDAGLARECSYLVGAALYMQGKDAPAAAELSIVAAEAAQSPSADHARAVLGRMAFAARDFPRAAFWWGAISLARRAEWQLESTLHRTLLLAGAGALQDQRFEDAARLLQEARDHGCAEPGLAGLIQYARLRAGTQLLYAKHATPSELERAALVFRQVQLDAGGDATVCCLLALVYKRLGRFADARNALNTVTTPDLYTLLQSGMFALKGGAGVMASPVQQAAQDWERALKLACPPSAADCPASPQLFAVVYNLLRAQLSLGQFTQATVLVERAITLAPTDENRRFLELLQALLLGKAATERQVAQLVSMPDAAEKNLQTFIRGLGNLDAAERLLQSLAAVRPQQRAVAGAVLEVTILRAMKFLQRCNGPAGRDLLAPLAKRQDLPAERRTGILNVFGCCCFLAQEYGKAARAFAAAVELDPNDPRLNQNLALASEQAAEVHQRASRYTELAQLEWSRYLDLMAERIPAPPGRPDYWDDVKFACLRRLTQLRLDAGQREAAADYLKQAHAVRPRDEETIEKLFHILNELQQFAEAKEMLLLLHSLREEASVVETLDEGEPGASTTGA